MESMLLSNVARFWFAIPLIIAISLVYAATRHELMEPILIHAWRIAVRIIGFKEIVFGILLAIETIWL